MASGADVTELPVRGKYLPESQSEGGQVGRESSNEAHHDGDTDGSTKGGVEAGEMSQNLAERKKSPEAESTVSPNLAAPLLEGSPNGVAIDVTGETVIYVWHHDENHLKTKTNHLKTKTTVKWRKNATDKYITAAIRSECWPKKTEAETDIFFLCPRYLSEEFRKAILHAVSANLEKVMEMVETKGKKGPDELKKAGLQAEQRIQAWRQGNLTLRELEESSKPDMQKYYTFLLLFTQYVDEHRILLEEFEKALLHAKGANLEKVMDMVQLKKAGLQAEQRIKAWREGDKILLVASSLKPHMNKYYTFLLGFTEYVDERRVFLEKEAAGEKDNDSVLQLKDETARSESKVFYSFGEQFGDGEKLGNQQSYDLVYAADAEGFKVVSKIPEWLYSRESLTTSAMHRGRRQEDNKETYWAPDMGNFSGIAHLTARRFFWVSEGLTLLAFFFPFVIREKRYRYVWIIYLVASILTLYAQKIALRDTIIPWKVTVRETDDKPFRLPLVRINAGVFVWLTFGSLASIASLTSRLSATICIADQIVGHKGDVNHWAVKFLAYFVLLLGFVPRLQVLLFNTFTCTKVTEWDDSQHKDVRLPCCLSKESKTQYIQFPECDNYSAQRDQDYMCTLAYRFRMTDWRTTHYECVTKYSAVLGMWFFTSMTKELHLANIKQILRKESRPFKNDIPAIRAFRQAQLLIRYGCEFSLPNSLCVNIPKLAIQILHFHSYQRSERTAINFLVMILSGFISFYANDISGCTGMYRIMKEVRQVEAAIEDQDTFEARIRHLPDDAKFVKERKARRELLDAQSTFWRYMKWYCVFFGVSVLAMFWFMMQVCADEDLFFPSGSPFLFVNVVNRAFNTSSW